MKRFKIGVFGCGRGADLATNFMLLNCDIVAVCDFNEERAKMGLGWIGKDVKVYTDFDEFIKEDMDAVILANYFHEHAPYAIKCFERGIHVFSECISNGTMAEGVELVRAWEKSPVVYMIAENYPQMIFNREMRKICRGGTLGKILYAEGEYNHPSSPSDVGFVKMYTYFPRHWRNFNARSYYVTHSLGPIMSSTGASPVRVTSFNIFAPNDREDPSASYVGDRAAIIMTQNDDGSVFRFTGCAGFGGHHNTYRICGTKGSIENIRGMGSKIVLHYNDWEKPEGANEVNIYEPSWDDKDEELIVKSGHGGADYLTCRYFLECIEKGEQPEHPFDIYSAVRMSSVAILAHRSMLEGGKPYDIPDMRCEEERKKYENDRLTPYYSTSGEAPSLPCCSNPDYAPTEEQIEKYLELLK